MEVRVWGLAAANADVAVCAGVDLSSSLSLMRRFAAVVFGPRGGIKTTTTRDDFHIGLGWAGAFAADRPEWTRIDSWYEVDRALRKDGALRKGWVAFVLLSRPGTPEGHPAGVYATPDAGDQWVDLTATAQRVIPLLQQRH